VVAYTVNTVLTTCWCQHIVTSVAKLAMATGHAMLINLHQDNTFLKF
jgi:hypothetical protein